MTCNLRMPEILNKLSSGQRLPSGQIFRQDSAPVQALAVQSSGVGMPSWLREQVPRIATYLCGTLCPTG